jgi:cell wall-associated NlpC family hydrolase
VPIARPALLRVLLAGVLLAAVLSQPGSPARGQASSLGAKQSRAQSLAAAVAAETRRIQTTERGLASAQDRLLTIESQLDARRYQLRQVGGDIVRARERLEALENRQRQATAALERNLVAAYESTAPDLVSVVMAARSFSDLLDTAEYARRIAEQNARILDRARDTRIEVTREAAGLVELQARVRMIAAAVTAKRDEAAAVRGALLAVQQRQVARREGTAARLSAVRAQIADLRARERREARIQAAAARDAAVTGISVDAGGTAQPPPGAPGAVAKVMAAGNAIAGLPYLWGGGHGSFQAAGYDCSGSLSYALAAAGLLSNPLDSSGFESWGEPGPGRWITVYANAGHAFMVVAGWRFDTSALAAGGTRWSRSGRSMAGFAARHPPGL